MQKIIEYLTNNEEVIQKVKEGTASLLGVTAEEEKAVLEVVGDGVNQPQTGYSYWK